MKVFVQTTSTAVLEKVREDQSQGADTRLSPELWEEVQGRNIKLESLECWQCLNELRRDHPRSEV